MQPYSAFININKQLELKMSGRVTLNTANFEEIKNCIFCSKYLDYSVSKMSDAFCCKGCRTAYSIREQLSGRSTFISIPSSKEKYLYLDEESFLKEYLENNKILTIYLEGIHCISCAWIIERLPQLVPGIQSIQFDYARSILRIEKKKEGSFAIVATILEEIGYAPHPIKDADSLKDIQVSENRKWMLKIGVAAACTGNIMLMTIPTYSGIEGNLKNIFEWISGILFLP